MAIAIPRILLAASFAFLPAVSLASQSPVDSLRKVLSTLPDDTGKVRRLLDFAEQVRKTDTATAELWNARGLILARRLKDPLGEAAAWQQKGGLLRLRQDHRRALVCYLQAWRMYVHQQNVREATEVALKIARTLFTLSQFADSKKYLDWILRQDSQVVSKKLRADALMVLANNLSEQGYWQEAMSAYMDAENVYEQLQDDKALANIYNNLGIVFRNMKNYAQAIAYFQKCIALKQEGKHSLGLVATYNNLGSTYRTLGHIDSALLSYRRAEEICQQHHDDRGLSTVWLNIGNLLQQRNDFDSAMRYYRKSQLLKSALSDNKGLAVVHFNIGELLNEQRQYASSLVALASAESLALAVNKLDLLADIKQAQAMALEQSGRPAEALQMLRLAQTYKDSVLNEMRISEMLRLTTLYETEKKDKEILLQKSQLVMTTAKLQRQRLYQLISILAAGCIILSGIVLFVVYRKRQQARAQQALNRIRSEIASDIHDDLGATASSLGIYHHLLRRRLEHTENTQELSSILEKAHRVNQDLQEHIGDLTWLIDPNHFEHKALLERVHQLARQFLEPCNITYHIRLDGLDETVALNVKRTVYLIVKEALNNISKYSQAKTVNIQLTRQRNAFELLIKDDGVGFEKEAVQTRAPERSGHGLKSMELRCQRLGGSLEIKSQPGQGTTVYAHFPLATNN